MKILCFVLALLLSPMLMLSSDQQKIKLYAIYSKSHANLVYDWFIPSVCDDYELIIVYHDQVCPSGKFYEPGWNLITMKKVELWIQAALENPDQIFICSDIDIQFFEKTESTIRDLMKNKDLIIQKEAPWGTICSGFFACRGNEKIIKLFQDILIEMKTSKSLCDQSAFQKLLIDNKNPYQLQWDYLPPQFFGAGTLTGKIWNPGDTLPIPEGIMLHHANWTKGVENKIKQLEYVKEEVLKGKAKVAPLLHNEFMTKKDDQGQDSNIKQP